MLETGQPLHYYDLSKLPHHEITVVDDVETKLTALDGAEFEIQKGDILITTGGEPTGVAGIMGGEESMIDENTKAILMEAAHFDHAQIRRTSIRLNLITEAASRFTKGLEPCSIEKGIARSVELLQKYADASGFEETVKAGNEVYQPILSHIPSYRTDIEGQADIDEEVIRLIGFDSLGSTLPQMQATVGRLSPVQALRRDTREILTALNLHEVVTYTLVGEDYIQNAYQPAGEAIALSMPMSEARKYIRTSLINSMLECGQYNEAHSNTDLAFFELSKVYGKGGKEEERLAIFLDGNLGNLHSDPLHQHTVSGDFYAMKGILTEWLKKCGFQVPRVSIRENKTDLVHFHPYRSAELWLDHSFLGVFGEVHPTYAAKYDLKRVVYAELNLGPVLAEELLEVVRKAGKKIVRSAEIFDVYEGEHVEAGKKSVALHIVYQASDHTLKEEEITAAHQAILDSLSSKLSAQLRA